MTFVGFDVLSFFHVNEKTKSCTPGAEDILPDEDLLDGFGERHAGEHLRELGAGGRRLGGHGLLLRPRPVTLAAHLPLPDPAHKIKFRIVCKNIFCNGNFEFQNIQYNYSKKYLQTKRKYFD